MNAATVPNRRQEQEAQSLDLVQRTVISALVAVVIGLFPAVLALYLVLRGEQDLERVAVIGLWILCGIFGLVTVGAILIINRRRPWHPWVVLGLLPMAASAFWILT